MSQWFVNSDVWWDYKNDKMKTLCTIVDPKEYLASGRNAFAKEMLKVPEGCWLYIRTYSGEFIPFLASNVDDAKNIAEVIYANTDTTSCS